jgi:hypothetical protein
VTNLKFRVVLCELSSLTKKAPTMIVWKGWLLPIVIIRKTAHRALTALALNVESLNALALVSPL